MKKLHPSYFFDLSDFEHRALFEKGDYVWQALSQIENYLSSYNLGIIKGNVSPNAYLDKKELIFIGEGTIVEPGALIKGPVIIGKNCIIRQGAYIRGNLITGNDCVIGHDTEVKNAIFLNHSKAAHFAYVGDSILGNHINLGAGTILANLKLDEKEVFIRMGDEKIPTNRKKLGAILGDNSQTGCNSVTNPGTMLGKNVSSYPCMNFGGFIPSNSLIKPSKEIKIVEK